MAIAPDKLKTYDEDVVVKLENQVDEWLTRYRGAGNPPPLHWKACDPSTIMRFKAVLTCPGGHGLTLRTHRIESNGAVRPSVICQFPGCQFHDFVRLRDWDLGQLGSIEDQHDATNCDHSRYPEGCL